METLDHESTRNGYPIPDAIDKLLIKEIFKPTLILTVGLPRAGKSTWAREYARENGGVVVNPDSIRLALYGQAFIPQAERHVWAQVETQVNAHFLYGYPLVILDATSITRADRAQWRSPKWELKFKLFNTSKIVCRDRAIRTNQSYLLDVIERMFAKTEQLSEEESKDVIP